MCFEGCLETFCVVTSVIALLMVLIINYRTATLFAICQNIAIKSFLSSILLICHLLYAQHCLVKMARGVVGLSLHFAKAIAKLFKNLCL